ncbi:MAG: molybdopterin-dependent oxidoreductase [Acidobacteriota bacterium]
MVGEKAPSAAALDLDSWRLRVDGRVAQPRTWTYPELLALPQRERTVDIHCVTGWSRFETRFTGVPLAEVLARSLALPSAAFVRFAAYSDRDHDTSLPLSLALEDTWLVHARDGVPLEPKHGYPLRTLTPSRYFYKSLKWLRHIEVLDEDRLGFWERESNYHNVGDPWPGDQRFTSGSLRPAQADRFRGASDFSRWRGPKKVLLGLDLRGWRPAGQDLSELALKACDLRGADLRDCDLRRANLSLSDLRGADLRNADLGDADLEGADFSGADLRQANLSRCALSATRFFQVDDEGGVEGAFVDGLRLERVSGLLESQEKYLRGAGVLF